MTIIISSKPRKYMFSGTALFLFTLCFLAAGTFAQDDKKKTDEQKKQEKAAKAAETISKRQDRIESRYQKIRTFADSSYDSDPDFKEAIDLKYRRVREDHKNRAYLVNMRSPSARLVREDGDKIIFDDTLYPNPLAQDFVNRVGQSVVPPNAARLYAFKIIQNPVPLSSALSNGTIYISTGYLSIIDNEAQLAYILAHEIAHVEKDHWYQDVLVEVGTQPYLRKNPFKSLIWAFQDAKDVWKDPETYLALKLKSQVSTIGWEPFQEDEADRDALKYMFDRNYDVREVPKLYQRLKTLTSDPRSQTGFIADPQRIADRLAYFNTVFQGFVKAGAMVGAIDLAEKRDPAATKSGARGIARMLGETMAPELQRKLDNAELMASSEEFQSTMALVKRDNGMRATQFDMYAIARYNLEDSISIRSNDPFAYYYYGKVMRQTARNSAEVSKALQNLTQSIDYDKRQTLAEPYLYRAMLRLGARNPNEAVLIANDLRKYVEIYQRENKGDLPPYMDFVYDFMQDLGVLDYRATPTANTTEAIKPIFGSQPSMGQAPVQQSAPAVTVVPMPTPAKTKSGGKKP